MASIKHYLVQNWHRDVWTEGCRLQCVCNCECLTLIRIPACPTVTRTSGVFRKSSRGNNPKRTHLVTLGAPGRVLLNLTWWWRLIWASQIESCRFSAKTFLTVNYIAINMCAIKHVILGIVKHHYLMWRQGWDRHQSHVVSKTDTNS